MKIFSYSILFLYFFSNRKSQRKINLHKSKRKTVMPKTSEIKFLVTLDDTKLPEKILWKADDSEFTEMKEAKTLMLSLWDKDEKVTLGFDIWTKEMMVEDMNIHFHQTFVKLADTYQQATNNSDIGDMIKKFAAEFADKLNLFSGEKDRPVS